VLDEGQSAAVGDELSAEVASFTSADSAVMWAARVLGAKNSLVAADAKLLEDAFEQKFSGLILAPCNRDFRGRRWRCKKDRKIPILEM
jgi:hypothetical protein